MADDDTFYACRCDEATGFVCGWCAIIADLDADALGCGYLGPNIEQCRCGEFHPTDTDLGVG